MLINFTFKNYRSFYQKNVFSMQAVNDNTLCELNTFKVNENMMNKGDNELLKSAVIFGSNASGKSNLIKALYFMRNSVLFSASQLPIVSSNETFAFYDEAKNEESSYEVEIIENNTYYRYGFSILNGKIREEWLDRRKERLIHVFKRTGTELKIMGLSKHNTEFINVSPYSLFLSVSNSFQLAISSNLKDVMQWFKNLYFVFGNNINDLNLYKLNNGIYMKQALEIFKMANIGIQDIKVIDKTNNENLPNIYSEIKFNEHEKEEIEIDVLTTFNVYNKQGRKSGTKEVLLFKNDGFNSEGTVKFLHLLGSILACLNQGRVILVDDIDSKLDFNLVDYILKMYNSIHKNVSNAQLICTAYNAMLMDNDLRRDQIYISKKNQYGESYIVSLADYKNVRKNDLFSKKYLAGFYS